MTKSYCDLFPPRRTEDSEAIIFGYIVRTTKLQRSRRQTLDITKSIYEAYVAEHWAIFPSLDCMIRYITELENLHLELDGKREITREDIKQKIRQIERSRKTDEEFSLLMRKGYNLPGISKPSVRLPLPIDPEIVWVFETGRFKRVVESWTLPVENSDLVMEEARDQLEAAAWLDVLANVEEYEGWKSRVSLRPQFIQRLRPLPQTSSPK